MGDRYGGAELLMPLPLANREREKMPESYRTGPRHSPIASTIYSLQLGSSPKFLSPQNKTYQKISPDAGCSYISPTLKITSSDRQMSAAA